LTITRPPARDRTDGTPADAVRAPPV